MCRRQNPDFRNEKSLTNIGISTDEMNQTHVSVFYKQTSEKKPLTPNLSEIQFSPEKDRTAMPLLSQTRSLSPSSTYGVKKAHSPTS
jgi:hypothetical protein